MPFVVLFIYGVLAACFALVIELLILTLANISTYTAFNLFPFSYSDSFSPLIVGILILVAVIEEGAKYLFLRQYAKRFFRLTLSNREAAFFLGALFGVGFAALEVLLILRNTVIIPVVPISGLLAFHMLTSILMSLFLFAKTLERPRIAWRLLTITIVLHTLYNVGAFFLS